VIANAEATAAGRDPLPNAAAAGRKGACASRTNTFFSIPLLFFMAATSHFAAVQHTPAPSGSHRLVYWLVVLVIAIVFEGIALSAPAVGKPQAWHIDKHKNTIIAGFVAWAVLLIVFELMFKL
jgi:uncharacterized membrane protein